MRWRHPRVDQGWTDVEPGNNSFGDGQVPVMQQYRLPGARYSFLNNSSSSVTSARIAAFSVGSRSGAHSGECGAGPGMPVFWISANLDALTAPMCSNAEGTLPVFQYSPKSSDVIFAGISTTDLSPRAVFSAAARRAVSAGSL